MNLRCALLLPLLSASAACASVAASAPSFRPASPAELALGRDLECSRGDIAVSCSAFEGEGGDALAEALDATEVVLDHRPGAFVGVDLPPTAQTVRVRLKGPVSWTLEARASDGQPRIEDRGTWIPSRLRGESSADLHLPPAGAGVSRRLVLRAGAPGVLARVGYLALEAPAATVARAVAR